MTDLGSGKRLEARARVIQRSKILLINNCKIFNRVVVVNWCSNDG